MHFSTFFVSLSALAATSMAMPAPNPIAEPLAAPEPMPVAGEMAFPINDASGSLPQNFAKIWVYTGRECNVDAGPSYNVNIRPGQNLCLPYKNVGSIVAWYKSSIGSCKVTTHSGRDCKGKEWKPKDKQCVAQSFASVRVSCPGL